MIKSNYLKFITIAPCTLLTAAWVFNFYIQWSNEKALKPKLENDLGSLVAPFGVKDNHANRKDNRPKLLSKPPPFIPLDIAALDQNFHFLKLVTQKLFGRQDSQFNELMKLKVPLFSTTNWRLHTPSGRNLSIESIQRTLLLDSDGYPVPNAAHYVLQFPVPVMQFHHMVSILSCIHVMKPQLLFLWYAPGYMARGKWWDRLRSNLTESEWEKRIVMAMRPTPEYVYTRKVEKPEHKSDIMRMEALLMFGGAYFDHDAVVLKPLKLLRRFPLTLGREISDGLANSVILSEPNNTFLAMWHTAYQVFDNTFWAHHSIRLPHLLHQNFPGLCHVEETSLVRPNWTPEEVKIIFGVGLQNRWDWRAKNFVLHLWFRFYNKQHDMDSIRSLNSMYGEVLRFILYGTTNLL